jgi:hypothetical protein
MNRWKVAQMSIDGFDPLSEHLREGAAERGVI